MFLTGFADEAGRDLESQIRATLELKWNHIDIRLIGDTFFGMLPEAEFEHLCARLSENNITVNCYGSSIANGETLLFSREHYERSRQDLIQAIPRMKKLGVPMLRGMSFRRAKGDPDTPEIRKYVFEKVNEFVDICADNGIIYAHENCCNYGGCSFEHTLRLLDNIRHKEAFTLIFDTGNTVGAMDRRGCDYSRRQSSWEFYRNIRDFVSYVHIKDGTAFVLPDGTVQPPEYCFPGDGEGDVRAILLDLLRRNYDGGFCMEPHMIMPPKVELGEAEQKAWAEKRYKTYIGFARRFEKLLASCREQIEAEKQGILL